MNGQEVTVTLKLMLPYTNYKQLKDAVETVGKTMAATAELQDLPLATADGLTLDPTQVTNVRSSPLQVLLLALFESFAKNTVTNVTRKNF